MGRDELVQVMARALAECVLWRDMDGQGTLKECGLNDAGLRQLAQAALAALEARGLVVVPRDVILFLGGAAPLEGVWFGERHPTERGAFWWRKYLPAPPIAAAGGEG